jgi:hypothetical protein
MKKLMCLVVGMAMMLFACSSLVTSEMVNSEINLKQTVITMALGASTACQTGIMAKKDCFTAAQSYALAQVGANTALQMLLLNCKDDALKAQIQTELANRYPTMSFDRVNK